MKALLRLLIVLGVLARQAARADERFDVICVRTPCGHLVARLEERAVGGGLPLPQQRRGPDQKEWLSTATTGELYRTEGRVHLRRCDP